MSNLYFTTKGAPNMFDGSKGMVAGQTVTIGVDENGDYVRATVKMNDGEHVTLVDGMGEEMQMEKPQLEAMRRAAMQEHYQRGQEQAQQAQSSQQTSQQTSEQTHEQAPQQTTEQTLEQEDGRMSKPIEVGAFGMYDEVKVDVDGTVVHGMVSEVYDDGSIEVAYRDGKKMGYIDIKADEIGERVKEHWASEEVEERDVAESPDVAQSDESSESEKSVLTEGAETGENGKENVASNDTPLSKTKKDEYGKPLVLSKDGTTEFGSIDAESGLTAAPIRLSLGENTVDENGKNHGYGLLHLEAAHGDEIRRVGYDSVKDFVEAVARNYTDIREGGVVADNQTYLLEVVDKHNNTLFIQLSKDGSYWNVNSAGIFRKTYSRRKPKVYTVPAVGGGTVTDTPDVNSGHSKGATAPAGNSLETSEGKVSDFASDKQVDGEKSLDADAKGAG